MRVIDAHTHIFPDRLAEKATVTTANYFDLPEPPNHYGSVQELLAVLDEAGIAYALVFSAATTAHQVESINRYIHSNAQKYKKFIPCGSMHAEFAARYDFKAELRWMREHGLHGLKLHPEFQHFVLDDERMFPVFEEMEKTDMFLISHTGDPRVEVSGPERMQRIAETFPKLRCIATHMGSWGDWDPKRVAPLAKLPNVYVDISSSYAYVEDKEAMKRTMSLYDPKHLFFGSDYPIWCPKKELQKTLDLQFPQDLLEDILFNNFARFYHYKEL